MNYTLHGIGRDIKYCFRQWRHARLITTVGLLSLVLGIGGSIVLFSLVDALMLKSLPLPDAGRLVMLKEPRSISNPLWEYIRDHQPVFETTFAASSDRFNTAAGGEVSYVSALLVSGNFFEALRLRPAFGRALSRLDDRKGGQLVAMISYGLWLRQFGGAPSAIGSTIWLESASVEIVGVSPKGFYGLDIGRAVDIFLPINAMDRLRPGLRFLDASNANWIRVFGLLRSNRTFDQSAIAIRKWQPSLAAATRPMATPQAGNPDEHLRKPIELQFVSQQQTPIREQYGRPLLLLLAAIGVVLLVCCGNIATGILARATDKQRELAVRLSIGASRSAVAQLVVLDATLLSVVGAALAVGFAIWGTWLIVPHLTTAAFLVETPFLDVTPNWRVAALVIIIAIGSGILAGLAPAVHAFRLSTSIVMHSSHGGSGRTLGRWIKALVAFQLALSLILVSAAAVLGRAFVELTTQNAGFDAENVTIAEVRGALGGTNEMFGGSRIEVIRDRLRAIPGITTVTASAITPIGGTMAFANVEVPDAGSRRSDRLAANRVLPGYFTVMGTPLLRGRDFNDHDNTRGSRVAIVNLAFERRYFQANDAVGKVIRLGPNPATIIAVVGNAKYSALTEPEVPVLYAPVAQWNASALHGLRFSFRTRLSPAVRRSIVKALSAIDPRLTVEFRTLAQDVGRSVSAERLLAWCGAFFAVLALLIAVIGVHGSCYYSVVRRHVEIAVRMAVGATPRSIVSLIMSDLGVVIGIGIASGCVGSLVVNRALRSLFIHVKSTNVETLALACLAMVAAAASAGYMPASRAARIDPLITLRDDS